jgi:hypothetical protein
MVCQGIGAGLGLSCPVRTEEKNKREMINKAIMDFMFRRQVNNDLK